MRGLTQSLPWALLLPILLSGLSSPPVLCLEVQQETVRISEVCPDFASEYIILENIASLSIDLYNWSLSDGEGRITINGSVLIGREERIALCSNPEVIKRIYPGLRVVSIGINTSSAGRFALANEGDELFLTNAQGRIVDCLVYGKGNHECEGWIGVPVSKIPAGDAAIRLRTESRGSSLENWYVAPAGRSEFKSREFDAVVEPFLFPENGLARILREINCAQRSIDICVYDFSSFEIAGALAAKISSGIRITILIEGQPVAGMSNSSIGIAQILQDAQCTVKMIKTMNDFRRYDYVHCKYAIFDDKRTVVMSENWNDGLQENRGWGAVVDSRDFAGYMKLIFQDDIRNASFDVMEIDALPDHRKDVISSNQYDAKLGDLLVEQATVRPLVSPDNSFLELARLIDSARERVLVQQLYCEPDWIEGRGLLDSVLNASERGAMSRILLARGWSDDSEELCCSLNSIAHDRAFDLEARCVSSYHDFGLMHNKGIVVDDCSVVSSINWVDSALFRNREVGVIIQSRTVSEFFTSTFFDDWAIDPYPPTLTGIPESLTGREDIPIMLDASACFDQAGIVSVEWDLGVDGTIDWTGTRCLISLPPGEHVVILTVTDSWNNSASRSIRLSVLPTGGVEGTSMPWLILSVPIMAAIIVAIIRRMRSK